MKKDQASSTAFTVLQGFLYTANQPQHAHLVSEEMKEAAITILSASREGQRRLRQLQSWYFPRLAPFLERMVIPGISLHYVLRKRFIENQVLRSIEEGAQQVINLGAGFDTIAYRHSKQFPHVNFVEVDHPATHAVKRAALEVSTQGRENLHFIPVDFTTQRQEDVLKASPAVKPDRPTVVIIEGVLMYLEKPQVEHLFRTLPEFLHTGKRVVFTAVKPVSDGVNFYGPLMQIYLAIKKEPLKWTCTPNDLGGFVQALDFDLTELAGAEEFKAQYLPANFTGFVHDGEYLAVAEQGWQAAKSPDNHGV